MHYLQFLDFDFDLELILRVFFVFIFGRGQRFISKTVISRGSSIILMEFNMGDCILDISQSSEPFSSPL